MGMQQGQGKRGMQGREGSEAREGSWKSKGRKREGSLGSLWLCVCTHWEARGTSGGALVEAGGGAGATPTTPTGTAHTEVL